MIEISNGKKGNFVADLLALISEQEILADNSMWLTHHSGLD